MRVKEAINLNLSYELNEELKNYPEELKNYPEEYFIFLIDNQLHIAPNSTHNSDIMELETLPYKEFHPKWKSPFSIK